MLTAAKSSLAILIKSCRQGIVRKTFDWEMLMRTLGLFHLKVWKEEERKVFWRGDGPKIELIFPIRLHMISGRKGGGGVEFLIIFRPPPPPPHQAHFKMERPLPPTLLEIFCKIVIDSKVIEKSILDPDDNLCRNSKALMGYYIWQAFPPPCFYMTIQHIYKVYIAWNVFWYGGRVWYFRVRPTQFDYLTYELLL